MGHQTTCPECGSNDIYYEIGADRFNGTYGNHILINKGLITRGAALDIYVCGNCGYVRTFISAQEALDEIKEKWTKLTI